MVRRVLANGYCGGGPGEIIQLLMLAARIAEDVAGSPGGAVRQAVVAAGTVRRSTTGPVTGRPGSVLDLLRHSRNAFIAR
jgi:hypothetical protein